MIANDWCSANYFVRAVKKATVLFLFSAQKLRHFKESRNKPVTLQVGITGA
jgi:hypothetical protein